jgi:hypothetical protein
MSPLINTACAMRMGERNAPMPNTSKTPVNSHSSGIIGVSANMAAITTNTPTMTTCPGQRS